MRRAWAGIGVVCLSAACSTPFTVRLVGPRAYVFPPGRDWSRDPIAEHVDAKLKVGCEAASQTATFCFDTSEERRCHLVASAQAKANGEAEVCGSSTPTCPAGSSPRTVEAKLDETGLSLSVSGGACVVPRTGAIDCVLNALREARRDCVAPSAYAELKRKLPATMDETLGDAYGLGPIRVEARHGGWLDLQPGMRLRVEAANYREKGFSERFATSAVHYFEIGRAPHRDRDLPPSTPALTFDALVSRLDPQTTASYFATSILDLHASAFAYWRIVYPSSPPASRASEGTAHENNVLLFGTNDSEILEDTEHSECLDLACPSPEPTKALADATAAPASAKRESDGRAPTTCRSMADADHACLYFYGRTALIAEVMVYVNGRAVHVPVGTTLANILARSTNWVLPDAPETLVVERLDRGKYRPVEFRLNRGTESYDLPLLKGDRITW